MSGKLKLIESGKSPVAVGDFVEFSTKDPTIATVENVLERAACLSRPATAKKEFTQVLVSNVDRLVIVTSTAQPKFNHGIVDRFLVIAFKEKLQPVIVLNKTDLADPEKFGHFFSIWKSISCATLFTSAVTGEGIEGLKKNMMYGTSAMAGHSGVGKSTLLNRISPGLNLKIGKISSYSGRGVHTTSRASLFKIADDGWVADTPGLKVLGFGDVNRKNLKDYYPDFQRYSAECRFLDCRHINEPGCAVKDSIGTAPEGIAAFRYENYKRIYNSVKNPG